MHIFATTPFKGVPAEGCQPDCIEPLACAGNARYEDLVRRVESLAEAHAGHAQLFRVAEFWGDRARLHRYMATGARGRARSLPHMLVITQSKQRPTLSRQLPVAQPLTPHVGQQCLLRKVSPWWRACGDRGSKISCLWVLSMMMQSSGMTACLMPGPSPCNAAPVLAAPLRRQRPLRPHLVHSRSRSEHVRARGHGGMGVPAPAGDREARRAAGPPRRLQRAPACLAAGAGASCSRLSINM